MYDFFTEPEYLKSANDLKALNSEIEAQNNLLKNDKDPNAPREPIKPVNELKPVGSLQVGGLENTFDVSTLNPETQTAPEIGEKSIDSKLSFLGEQGTDQIGAAMAFANDVFTTSQTKTPNAAAGIANTLKMGASGAKAGMAIGGPLGAGIGAGAGLIYGGIDAAMDIKSINKEKVLAQKKIDKELTDQRLQGERSKDGLDSLTKLTAIRKQQSEILG